jgi:hypothetical protein
MAYLPLNGDRNEIRLITILPPDIHSDELHCTLENASLDDFTPEYRDFVHTSDATMRRDLLLEKWIHNRQDAFGLSRGEKWPWTIVGRYTWTDYIALSYTWGDPGTTDAIMLNGQRFDVTRNLYLALHQLRESKYFATGVKLWVDAICINQNDTPERNLQVQRMRDIYIRAFNTFVWLGPEADDSTRAISLLDIFAKGNDMIKMRMPVPEEPFSSDEASRWVALYKFLDRPYWKRVWIIQELIVSYSTVTMFCGQTQLSLDDLAIAARSMGKSLLALKECIRVAYRTLGLLEPPVSIKALLARIIQLNLPFSDMIKSKDHRALPVLLDLSRNSEQTDLKDKLYAMLGLLDREVAHHITPDYNLPPWKVFASFPKAMITATGRLDILRQCTLEDEDDPSMPSWVPDLTTVMYTNDITYDASFNACGDIPANFQFVQDDRGLFVLGYRIDAVDGLGCTFWDMVGNESSISQSSSTSITYDTEQAVKKALYRSLVAAEKEDVGNADSDNWEQLLAMPPSAPIWYDENLRKHLESVRSFLTINKEFLVGGRKLEEWFSSDEGYSEAPSPSSISKLDERYSRMLLAHTHRRLMTTSEGRVGIAPKASKQGDIVCILFGSSTPLVIRPVPDFENCFTLVGECYVEGVMDGESLGWILTEKCHLENFVLC